MGLMCPATTNAAIYYVAMSGNDANPGNEAAPLRNIKYGVSKLFAGDTLYVKAGIYYEAVLSWETPSAVAPPGAIRSPFPHTTLIL
ncbi:MAG: hypothetical protein R3C68_19465 [Myxococcota bacterium]